MAGSSGTTKGPTPKKGSARHQSTGGLRTTHRASLVRRYTAPLPKSSKTSPSWFGYLLLGLALVGILLVVLNYMKLLPGSVSGWYLVAGVGFLGSAFVLSTRWR
ncbi:MAG TPA: cell division protein CrgA [Acidimicrobiales bacterium]|nr:cell division protein CrgA [Acidimicrobiales bacterium]